MEAPGFPEPTLVMSTPFERAIQTALGKVPTVVIAGDEDVLTPHSHGRYLAKQIAGATLVTSEGCGHFSMFEDADQFIAVLDELADKVAADQ